ncbi:MAG: zinc ribbon domain-containing protein [bacterium]
MELQHWRCPKCQHNECETDEIASTGTGLTKVFDIQNKKFTALSCTQCRYTEFYKGDTSMLGNIFDFFTG